MLAGFSLEDRIGSCPPGGCVAALSSLIDFLWAYPPQVRRIASADFHRPQPVIMVRLSDCSCAHGIRAGPRHVRLDSALRRPSLHKPARPLCPAGFLMFTRPSIAA